MECGRTEVEDLARNLAETLVDAAGPIGKVDEIAGICEEWLWDHFGPEGDELTTAPN